MESLSSGVQFERSRPIDNECLEAAYEQNYVSSTIFNFALLSFTVHEKLLQNYLRTNLLTTLVKIKLQMCDLHVLPCQL